MQLATQIRRPKFKFVRPVIHRIYTIPIGSKVFCPIYDGSKYLVSGVMGNMHSPCVTEKGNIVFLSNAQPLKKLNDQEYTLA